jgi:phosphoribosylglycinamide formyltransferase 2
MLDGRELEKLVRRVRPDFIVPEIEAIRTEKLLQLEAKGYHVVPCAKATDLTMNRDRIRDFVADQLKVRTARYAYAETADQLLREAKVIGFPCVIKPVMSSSGKGQSIARSAADLVKSWDYAQEGRRGDTAKVIVEEFIRFRLEITLLTIRQRRGPTLFAPVIGHRQERGDYQESWQPAAMSPTLVRKAQRMAKKVTDALGGYGLFGVEFFVTANDVIFSELSPRPHDTGMVTLISQNLNEFDLHLRAFMGLPIPEIEFRGPSASAVILSKRTAKKFSYSGLERALFRPRTEVRIFGKPETRPHRRMGVALARGRTTTAARKAAEEAARQIRLTYK